jgi:hypothetical protein
MMLTPSGETVLDRARVREVVGIFHSLTALKEAGDDLMLAGFDRADVDVIAPPDEVRRKLGAKFAYIPAKELADVPGVPRQPFLADDDVVNIKIVAGSTLGSISALFTALILFVSGYSPAQIGAAGVLVGLMGVGLGLIMARHFLGEQKIKALEPLMASRGLIMWVRVHSDEQEDQARELLIRHGANAVRVHEIDIVKTTEDLPLGSIRPDPWLGSERLSQP